MSMMVDVISNSHAMILPLHSPISPCSMMSAPASQVTARLVVAAGLAVACAAGHFVHHFPGMVPSALHLLASPAAHAALSLFAMLGERLRSPGSSTGSSHLPACQQAPLQAAAAGHWVSASDGHTHARRHRCRLTAHPDHRMTSVQVGPGCCRSRPQICHGGHRPGAGNPGGGGGGTAAGGARYELPGGPGRLRGVGRLLRRRRRAGPRLAHLLRGAGHAAGAGAAGAYPGAARQDRRLLLPPCPPGVHEGRGTAPHRRIGVFRRLSPAELWPVRASVPGFRSSFSCTAVHHGMHRTFRSWRRHPSSS